MSFLFENRVKGSDSASFVSKVKQIAYMLGYDPEWLMLVMNNESGFKPDAVNPYSGATGLIQFMPDTATWLGTSTGALKSMNRNQQLDWILKYYQKWKQSGKVARNSTDLALITFYPYAVNQPDEYKIGSEKSLDRARSIAKQNPGLDINRDGYISVLDYKKWLAAKLPKGLSESRIKEIIGLKATRISAAIFSLLGFFLAGRYILFHKRNKS